MKSTSVTFASNGKLTTEEVARATRYLSETCDALAECVNAVPACHWDFKPASDSWSISEIIEHITLLEERVHGIIGGMSEAPEAASNFEHLKMDEIIVTEVPNRTRRGKAPASVQPTGKLRGVECLECFIKRREKSIELLSAPALRGHVVPHPYFGPWDGYQWLLAAAAHCARHTEQIRELRADPKFPHSIATA